MDATPPNVTPFPAQSPIIIVVRESDYAPTPTLDTDMLFRMLAGFLLGYFVIGPLFTKLSQRK
jgi:hypothetical protein